MRGKKSKARIEEEPDPVFSSVPGRLEVDYDKYLPEMEEFDMTEEQKREFLDTLWRIMQHFVDEAWKGKS